MSDTLAARLPVARGLRCCSSSRRPPQYVAGVPSGPCGRRTRRSRSRSHPPAPGCDPPTGPRLPSARAGRGEPLPALEAARLEHVATAGRRHPGAEPVGLAAVRLLGLIRSLYRSSPARETFANRARGRHGAPRPGGVVTPVDPFHPGPPVPVPHAGACRAACLARAPAMAFSRRPCVHALHTPTRPPPPPTPPSTAGVGVQ